MALDVILNLGLVASGNGGVVMTSRNFAVRPWALSRRGLMTGAGGLGLAAVAGPAAARRVEPHALADFFVRDTVRHVALSPSGNLIAIIRELTEDGTRRAVLDVIDAADTVSPPKRSTIGDVDCEAMEWAGDDRLLVRVAVTMLSRRDHDSARSFIADTREEITSRRMISIDPATGGAVVLFENQLVRMQHTRNLGRVVDLMPDDPEAVLMMAPAPTGVYALYRVNVFTGHADEIDRGTPNTFGWETQNGVPILRYDVIGSGNAFRIMARGPGERDWRFARRVRMNEAPDFVWIASTDRAGVIVVATRLEGEDVMTVRELDVETWTFGAPIAARERADVVGGLVDDRGDYLAAIYWNDRVEYDFATPDLAPHHRAMNRFFDDECNVRLVDIDRSHNRFVAYVSGTNEPGAWYLYDRAGRSFINLTPRTALQADRLGRGEALDVTTRDGATIRAYLTAPAGGAPGPLIVMPHGGPEVRDLMDWDRTVQVLAAQGWWVLQPNFRGSGGYGLDFAGEGWGRWGERMQEDVEDAVDHVVRTRGLDADRVGIMGASYGGYAALMGAVRRPDLYKAAVAICGVFDLPDMLAYEERDDRSPDNVVFEYWTQRIGDRNTDATALAQASPRRRSAEIRCPVILVHGVDDPIVPVVQSRRMRDALARAGGRVELVEVRDAGHGDWEDDVEQGLLARYIALFRTAFA
jgi:dipeptidyl aminopeptidase/acylaminoacyl peptidase